jgi:dihydrofolate reductase
MAVWETNPALAKLSDLTADFASVWQAADKVVYSTTLTDVSTATTRLERDFDPAAVQELKAAATSDLTIGGANLAARAFAAGLVDQYCLNGISVVIEQQLGEVVGRDSDEVVRRQCGGGKVSKVRGGRNVARK